MAALNFPSSPTVGQLYTANGKTWMWDGVSWLAKPPFSGSDWMMSGRDFANGTIITTNIPYDVYYGDPFVLEMVGNSYSGVKPFDVQVQGYIYSNTLISYGGISNGRWAAGNITVLCVGADLTFWFPRDLYWQGFTCRAYVPSGNAYPTNRITSITNGVKPTGVKEVVIPITQGLDSDNYNTYVPTLTGTGATGNWNINSSTASLAANSSLLQGLSANALFNNTGLVHASNSDFNNIPNFGAHYVAGASNAPSTGGTQFYSLSLGLGSQYDYYNYALQFAFARDVTIDRYISIRNREGGTWSAWYKAHAGYADTANSTANITVIEDTSNILYPIMVSAAGTKPAKITSSKLSFDANTGTLSATVKSFLIEHPRKPGWTLRHGSLEGPENGVYIRGRLTKKFSIILPEYWSGLVDPKSITVNLTPINTSQSLYVKDIIGTKYIFISNETMTKELIDCFYTIFAERIDVAKVEVEKDVHKL